MKFNSLTLWLALALVAFVSGCQHDPAVNTISNAEQFAQVNHVIDQRLIMDKTVDKAMFLADIRESTTNDGFKRIQVFLKNCCKSPFAFSYRFNWYDENGVEMETADDEMWKQVNAVPGDDVTLTSVAPAKNCWDFKLRIVSRY